MSRERKISQRPELDRNLARVDPDLRATLRRLVTGELPWPLYLHGPAGTGKSCAALCVCDHARGPTAYHTASGWAKRLADAAHGRLSWRHEGNSGPLTEEMVWKEAARASLFVLDDLATRDRVSDWAYESVFNLLEERKGKPLIVTGNHGLEKVAELYDDRVASRLAGGTAVLLGGKDRRLWRPQPAAGGPKSSEGGS